MEAREDFSKRIARARELGREAIFEDILIIADTPMEGVETETSMGKGEDGDEPIVKEKRGDMLGHRKLMIEARFKLLAKWDPKRFGDSITHKGDADAPMQLILSGSDIHG